MVACGIRTLANFGLESAIKLNEEIRQPTKDWKPESSTRNLESTAWNLEC